MKTFWAAAAILAALLVQSGLSRLAPGGTRIVDPFLLVVVYCALTGGETAGMLTGAAAGWIQDIHFGGSIIGLSGLAGLLLGFGVGLAGSRFLFVGAFPRLLVLFGATLVQALLVERLGSLFNLHLLDLSVGGLFLRALANALVGALAFEVIDLRHRREVRS